jgi:hypothetical protein
MQMLHTPAGARSGQAARPKLAARPKRELARLSARSACRRRAAAFSCAEQVI